MEENEPKRLCSVVLPAELMAKVEAACPFADWAKLFDLLQTQGTVVAETCRALWPSA